MKLLKTLILAIVLFAFSQTTIYAQLSYADGGPSVEDPGLEVDIELRRYVNAMTGNDANDGKTQATAWQTLGKVVSERNSYLPGFHILFKRGQSWTGSIIFYENPQGTEGKRIVFGAYGSLLDARPIITKIVLITSYWMVRDIQSGRFAIADGHHSIFYNNICFGGGNNGLMSTGKCHHTAFVSNLIYDVDNNDAISIHGVNWSDELRVVESHHWVLDNVVIGNSGMEDGIDVSMGAPGYPVHGDVKVVYNRVQMTAVPGLSKRTGSGRHQIIFGHPGINHWVVGNTLSGGTTPAINLGGKQSVFKVSGNIAFKGNVSSAVEVSSPTVSFENNTVHIYASPTIPYISNSTNSTFLNNMIIRNEGGYWAQFRTNPIAMDNNWWGHSDNPTINGQSLGDWSTSTGFELKSGVGVVAGITEPVNNAYNHDPRNWTDQVFLDQFIPSSEFNGLDGIIPGAYDNKGKRQGMAILPHLNSGLENGGLGWEGPLLVQQRLKELGISFGNPLLAKTPSPKDKSSNVSITSDLSWTPGDSTISHNVYLGTNADSLILKSNQVETTFFTGTLAYETTYYWRVDEVTNDSTLTGTLWSFTTEEEPIAPTLAENPNPLDKSIDVRTSLQLSWKVGKRTRSSKVYFGTTNPPQFVSTTETNTYNPGVLELNTKYYWKVDGVNEWGETAGTVWSFTTESVASLPQGWVSLDIGKVGLAGDESSLDNIFTITASGTGVQGNLDQFRYLYRALDGDGEIIARVVSLENTSSSAMAGIMIREKLDSTSMYHLAALTSLSGTLGQWRSSEGGSSNTKIGSSVSFPYWVKLQRVSDFLISSESSDGKKWKTLKTEKIKMQSEVQMGLVVTSGNNDSLCNAVFDNISINGVLVSVEDEEKNIDLIPSEFTISNYPNPFNPTTTIKYSIPNIEGNENFRSVQIKIYDITGSLVEELLREKKNAGTHKVIWNGKNRNGLQVSSGIYFYKVQLDDQIKTAKMLLMK